MEHGDHLWTTLEVKFMHKDLHHCFTAYEDLLNICLAPGKDMDTLTGCISTAIAWVKATRPEKFTLDNMDTDLHRMAILQSLEDKQGSYLTFTSSLTILLGTMSVKDLEVVLLGEEQQRKKRHENPDLAVTNSAHSSGTPYHNTPSSSSTTDTASPASILVASLSKKSLKPWGSNSKDYWAKHHCELCEQLGHSAAKCPHKAEAGAALRNLSSTVIAANAATVHPPSSPALPNPKSDTLWMADTGASAYMTSHGHWLSNIHPHHQAIQLADRSLVYSTGVGELELQLVIGDIHTC